MLSLLACLFVRRLELCVCWQLDSFGVLVERYGCSGKERADVVTDVASCLY